MRERRIIMVVLLTLMLCGAYGADTSIWVTIFIGVCLGVAFGLFDPEEGDDERAGQGR